MDETLNPQTTAQQPVINQPSLNQSPNTQEIYSPPQKKKGPVIAILSILLILALGAAGYFAYMYYFSDNTLVSDSETKQEITSPPSSNPTLDWETYTNDSLGFSIKYPSDVRVDKEFDDENNKATIFKGGNLSFEVMLRENPGTIDFDKYHYMDNPVTRTTTLSGLPANVYEMPNGYCDGPSCSDPSITYVVQKGTNLYHVSFVGDVGMSEMENQVLLSFRLIEKDNSEMPVSSKKFGYIKSMAYSNGFYTLSFDEAELINNDTKPNGYYISNPSEKTVILSLVDGMIVKETTLREGGTDMVGKEHSISDFYSMFSNDKPAWIDEVPYWFEINDEGEVTSILEQYLP